MLKFKLPQCTIRHRELFPLPVDSFPSPARPFPTHMEVMFSPWGFSPAPPPRADTTLGASDVTQFRLYRHHGLNITPPHHHTLKRPRILQLQANVFFRVRCRFKLDLIRRRKKKSILKCVLMTLDPISMLWAIILILFPFSHLCWLVSLTNAALLLWH